MHSPDAAADELERTVKDLGFHGLLVNGPTDGRFLDDPMFEPILARAEALSVPIYIHPGIPSEKVREAHFDRLPGNSALRSPYRPGAGTWRRRSTCCGWF
jgi:predicted TIM-barrel fold metal-dependent hydrolase